MAGGLRKETGQRLDRAIVADIYGLGIYEARDGQVEASKRFRKTATGQLGRSSLLRRFNQWVKRWGKRWRVAE